MAEDLNYAWTAIRRNPWLALASVVVLTLGIGLNASVFTILDGLFFRPRVERDPASFVHFSPGYTGEVSGTAAAWAISARDYRSFAAESRTVSKLAAWSVAPLRLENNPEPVLVLMVTQNYFDVYGLERMLIGRTFADDRQEAVISEELWQNRFGSAPDIAGRIIRLNGIGLTVVGVTPAGFSGRIRGPGIWIPVKMKPVFSPGPDWIGDAGPRWLTVEGRLAPGINREQARSELQVIASRLDRLTPGRRTVIVLTNGSLGEEPAMRATVFWLWPLLLAGPTLILLIACTNVAILQLSRAVVRRREMAIRLAMGASRWRLIRMLLTETLLLATVAVAVSVAVAYQAPWAFKRMVASTATPVFSLGPDAAVLGYLGAALLLTTCFAGLSPAAESLRVNLSAAMKTGEGPSGRGRASSRTHGLLVATQVAMSVVLLATAGLFLRAQRRAFSADPGFETQHVLIVQAHGGRAGLADALRAVPSVQVIAAGSPFPEDELVGGSTVVRVPRSVGQERKPAVISFVSPEFFAALGIPLLRGRVFAEGTETVVSDALAHWFWPGEDPLGKRLVLEDGTDLLVVGVARDLRSEHVGEINDPHVYRFAGPLMEPAALLVRFAGSAEPVERRIRDVILRFDVESFSPPKTLKVALDQNAERMSTIVQMVEVLALMALTLAVLGIHGVVALAAKRRTHEIGIRVALGATKPTVVGIVLSSGLRSISWGVAVGLTMAGLAARAIEVLLRRTPIPIAVNDPLLYFCVAVLLAGVGIAAMLVPAIRAAAADPMWSLRQD